LLLDKSGSIDADEWKQVVDFAKEMVDMLEVSESGTHMALVDYGSKTHTAFDFQTFTGVDLNTVNLKRKIEQISFPNRSLTFIDKALVVADSEIFVEANGMRKNSKKVSKVIFL
jgi:hypothetical protein